MSFCLPCVFTKDLANCATSIIVGTIANLATDVYVYIENKATGTISRFSATSSGGGVVTVTRGGFIFMTETAYEVWITLANAVNIENRVAFTIAGKSTADFCVVTNFVYVSTDTGTIPTYATQTITAE